MDVITNAINSIIYEIPEEILEDAFKGKRQRYGRRLQSIESTIREQVIEKRIKPDLENLGGLSIVLPLDGVHYDKLSDYSRIYTIPKSLTQGRSISQVMRVSLNVTSNYAERIPGQSNSAITVSPYARSIQSVIASHQPIPNITNAEVELLGDNVVKINDYANFSVDICLECLLSFTPELTEIKRPYYVDFARLATLACKAFIYKNLRLRLDKTRLEGGRDFGEYKAIVEEMSDANQMYNDLLDEKWGKILILNDQNRKQKSIMRAGKFKV